MSDEPEETTYYLRLLSMYMDLGTEIVLNVFIHHSPNKNAEHFLISNHTLLKNLNSKGILNKEEYDKAIEKPPNLKRFDISLLITLSINLFTKEQLPHPAKGWDKPPKCKDKSVGADLLRLRQIRNIIVGHHHAARLPKWRFDDEWEKVSDILLRIKRQISQEKEGEPEILAKIEAYRIQSLDSSLKNKHDPIIKEWHNDMSKIQEKVEKLTKRLEGFDVYFKNNCDRYERYITLLVKGGHFVLTSFIKNQVQNQQKDLRSILDENKVSLSRSLTDPKQIEILFPTEPDSALHSPDVSSWNVSLSAVVILHLFERNMGRSHKQAVKTIEDAQKNYVNTALIALDSNTFEDYSTNLKASIQVLSDFLDENQAKVYYEILENCKKKIAEEEFKTFMDELKSQGSQMKTFQDIFKETVRDTKGVLQEMITKGISFKNDRDLELKMITLGTDEQKKVLAEEILTNVWHEALNRSLTSSEFQAVKEEVMKIIAEIRKLKSVKDISIETRCILLQIACSSPSDMMNLINYFESDLFHDTLHSISSELGYYFNTAFAICSLLPIDSLWKIINLDDKPERRGIRLPIKVSSPAGMLEVRSLFKSERIANSTNSIADALSKHFGEQIDLNVCTDMKELEGVIDEGTVSSESCSDSSNADNDAEDECNFDQPAIQRTDQDNDDQEITYCISSDECDKKQTDKDTEVSSDITSAVMTTEMKTCISKTKVDSVPISASLSDSDDPVVSIFKDKLTIRDSRIDCMEDSDESDAAIFFENPVYYEDGIDMVPSKECSRYVSEFIDGPGYSHEMIKYRQQMETEADNLQSRHETSDKMSEKEYGSFGPAVDAKTFFENPVYYEDGIDTVPSKEYSRYVSELMDGLGYSYEMIKYRQQMRTEKDNLRNRHETFAGTRVTTGGKGEGTTLYLESDVDYMYIIKDIVCTDNPQDFNNQANITLFQTETLSASPGYTRLKLLRFDGKFCQEEISSSLFKSESGSDYLSSEFFIDAVKEISRQASLNMKLTIQPKSGPSTPTSNKYSSFDAVYCFRCFCSDILERWRSRPRYKGWPSSETVHEVSLLDGHVVPIGFKDSKNMYREWRICYSLAELHLMQNLNEAQLKVYILLKKISKSVLNNVCKDMTSYIMKNIILWMCEANGLGGFTQDLIMDRLCNCLQYLKKCVCESNLPSYMIPERNLFAGRLDIQQKQRLISLLSDFLKERGRMFMRCDKLRDAMIVMYKTPNMFREFSAKRDKVESLTLMMMNIRAETDIPEMSLEEYRHLLGQNEMYCDIQTQIDHLIHFNEQELRQMGKTDEEINDLWRKKLSQLLS